VIGGLVEIEGAEMTSRNNPVEKIVARILLITAKLLIKLERYEEALKCLDRVLKIYPNCREAIVDNAMALCRLAGADEVKELNLEYQVVKDLH
jgi:regulator of sirC expression with transglutaminase-like and TPR domain